MTFMYGLECEYPVEEFSEILKSYRPVSAFTPAQWLARSPREQQTWLAEAAKQAKDKQKVLTQKENHPLLPRYVVKDDTGNLELVFPPVQSKRELVAQMEDLKHNFGLGLLQGTISIPSSHFFTSERNSLVGWFLFLSENDFLEKLIFNYQKKIADPKAKAGYFLLQPFLGLATSDKIRRLSKLLKYQSQGEFWEPDKLDFISRNASSSKYVGSTVYRPDIAGPERICLEVRDAHRNADLLLQRLERAEFYLQQNLKPFASNLEAEAFKPEEDFEKLPDLLQKFVKQLLPISYPKAVVGFRHAELVYEVYRNFAYPMRNWSSWLQALGVEPQEMRKVDQAKEIYLESLQDLALNFFDQVLEPEHALDKALFCLLKFSADSGIMRWFSDWERKHFPKISGNATEKGISLDG